MRTEEPRAVRLKDYKPFDYRIREIALDFALDPEATRVVARMQVERATPEPAPRRRRPSQPRRPDLVA